MAISMKSQSVQLATGGTDEDVRCLLMLSNIIKFNQILSFHFISFEMWHIGRAQMPMSLLQTESSNHVDWYTLSNWIFLLTFFLIKINHFVFDFQTFISFVWIYETRIDTNEPPHSTKPQNLINEICVRVRADAQCSFGFVIVSNV